MEITVGSKAFFNKFSDFTSHDTDIVLIENNPALYKDFAIIKEKTYDVFAYREMTKNEFLEIVEHQCDELAMCVGKLIVPEVIHYFGITHEDLLKFKKYFNALDNRHLYEKIIFDAYIKNNEFKLTDEQLLIAYQEYKKFR